AAGLTRSTVSPLTVTLSAGQKQPNVNFGYSETTPPTCTEQSWAGPPFHGTMTFQDVGGGIVSLTIIKNVNFSVTMPGVSGTILPPSPPNVVATFSPPSRAPLAINATRIDGTRSATLTVKAVDVFGNTISCDPIATTVTKLRHERGGQTLAGIAAADHVVTIENGAPGLKGLDVVVNGVVFEVRKLADRETRVVDVKSAMRAGDRNTITLVPRGRNGESAVVTIADR
ncbi:MAG TPA: hypothetical protein VGY57_02155, partial [Vicinamibacterales bacterium]|nr:hypothetical protein [Vicinamibacterales bacterium]